jgi:hypothetical protein
MFGIETEYKGIMFRSRLEVRWAKFFDRMGWEWEYEPIDLNGYIPDFILKFKEPLLVEVKPEMDINQLNQYKDKLVNSGWKGPMMIVGATIWFDCCQCCLGRLLLNDKTNGYFFDNAILVKCIEKHYTIIEEFMSWACKVCGYYDGDHGFSKVEKDDIESIWRECSEKYKQKLTTPK